MNVDVAYVCERRDIYFQSRTESFEILPQTKHRVGGGFTVTTTRIRLCSQQSWLAYTATEGWSIGFDIIGYSTLFYIYITALCFMCVFAFRFARQFTDVFFS